MNWRHFFAIAAVLAASACASAAPTRTNKELYAPARAEATPSSSPVPSAVRAPSPLLDPLQERRLAEMDRVLGWRNTVFVNGQPALTAALPPVTGKFPYHGIAAARAFGFGHVRSLRYLCGYSREEPAEPPDEVVPFAPDGTLCPDVIASTGLVSDTDLKEVRAGLQAAEAEFRVRHSVVRTRCAFTPHHALVFYDARDVPIAKLVVCLTCGEILAVPPIEALGGKAPTMMNERLGQALRRIFDSGGLAPWLYDDDERAGVLAYQDRVLGPRGHRTQRGAELDARGSGLESSRRVAQLTSGERSRLCLWFQEEAWSNELYHFLRPGMSYECEDGPTLSSNTTLPCAPVSASCSATVGEVEACLRDLLHTDIQSLCRKGEPVTCSKVRGCLPGVSDNLARRP